MHIYMPDPHPGRCLNHRLGQRCLEAEGTEHVCRFIPPRDDTSYGAWVQAQSWQPSEPEPWVVPRAHRERQR